MTIPDFLPSLAAGAHDSGDGQACVMEYVSLLAGEEWSDRPDCTHPLLAHEARMVNDELGDRDRHVLVPLIGRLFGTTADSPELTARLRLRQVAAVVRLLEPATRPRVAGLLARAEAEVARQEATTRGAAGPLLDEERDASLAEAREVARAFPGGGGADDPSHSGLHERSARMAFVGLAGDVEPAEGWALVALLAAHRLAGSGECRADCGDTLSHARLRARELAELLDEYDAVTGREVTRLTSEQVRELSALVD